MRGEIIFLLVLMRELKFNMVYSLKKNLKGGFYCEKEN